MSEPSSHLPAVVRRTNLGWVEGTNRGDTLAFLGIPFAAAPVGELRFGAPAAHAGWDGIRPCKTYGATPLRKTDPFLLFPSPAYPGEETLNANVFVPASDPPEEGFPILVWVHGGSFHSGSNAAPWFDGDTFNQAGIIVVGLSYRLGFDGFGWIADAPSNRGLLDLIAGVDWVRDNAATFGGNPDNITLGGHSAGATCILNIIEQKRDICAKAIAQSPIFAQKNEPIAEATGRFFAEQMGVKPVLKEWQNVPEEQVIFGQQSSFATTAGMPRSPTEHARQIMAGQTVAIPFAPYTPQNASPQDHVPLLVGTTAHEYTSMGALLREPWRDMDASAALLRAGLPASIVSDFVALNDGLDWQVDRVTQLLTEIMFRVPTLEWVNTHPGETWMYDFRWVSPTYGTATHGVDLPFNWNRLADAQTAQLVGDAPPQGLADAAHSAWVRFIHTGDPGWPQWNGKNAHVFDEHGSRLADSYAASRLLAPLFGNTAASN